MKKAIEIRNLTFAYPDGEKALEDFSVDVFEGESLGIVGPNGAGKTTLLLHLNGVLNGGTGIRIFDVPLNKRNVREIRRRVGVVFQNPDDQLFMPTVFDDIAFGPVNLGLPGDEVRKRVRECLRSVGLDGYGNRHSHHLSTGEKKRVALATALALNPEILVFDEPTANLDPATKREFIDLLKSMDGKTLVVAGHDLELLKVVTQKVVVLNRGKKVAEGPTAEILQNEELLSGNRLI